jgi:DNA invertase Pin-like site-specific DNA recombinase
MLAQQARERSAAIAAGMEQARQQGIHVGRPAGGEAIDAFLAKDTSQRVAVLRDDPGLSIRKAAQVAGCRSIRCGRWPQWWNICLTNADNQYFQCSTYLCLMYMS